MRWIALLAIGSLLMAPSLVRAQSLHACTKGTSTTVTLPAISVNDLLIFTTSAGATCTAPVAYTKLDDITLGGVGDVETVDWDRLADGSEAGFTIGGTTNCTGSVSWAFCSYSGVNTSTPIRAHGGNFNSGADAILKAPSLTATAGDLYVGIGGMSDALTVSSTLTQRELTQFAGGSHYGSYLGDQAISSTGSTGTIAIGTQASTSFGWNGLGVLIEPAPAAPTATPTATATATATASPTATATATATATLTATPTATASPVGGHFWF